MRIIYSKRAEQTAAARGFLDVLPAHAPHPVLVRAVAPVAVSGTPRSDVPG